MFQEVNDPEYVPEPVKTILEKAKDYLGEDLPQEYNILYSPRELTTPSSEDMKQQSSQEYDPFCSSTDVMLLRKYKLYGTDGTPTQLPKLFQLTPIEINISSLLKEMVKGRNSFNKQRRKLGTNPEQKELYMSIADLRLPRGVGEFKTFIKATKSKLEQLK